MDDDRTIVFKQPTELARIDCPNCHAPHWRLYSDGVVQCTECDRVLDTHLIVEVAESE